MAKHSNIPTRLGGIALIVLGTALAVSAYHMSDSLGSQFSRAFTGSAPDEVLVRYIGGGISFVIGLVMSLK